MLKKLIRYGFLSSLFISGGASAISYQWIEADDLHLRADIQTLSDAGIITVPTTTYPLMWSGVIGNLNRTSSTKLADVSPMIKDAYLRVKHRYQSIHRKNYVVEASVGGGTDEAARFQHFGSPLREKGEATVGVSGMDGAFAYNIEATYALDAQDDEDFRMDGSYISAIWGNWIFSAGQYSEFYGPGWDTGLIMSTNARPIPSINLTRNNPEAFDVPVLKWLGPWTLTTGLGWMNDDDYRAVDNTLLWKFRSTIKPIHQLELGFSRTAQMCGDDQSCDANAWWKMLSGDSNTTVDDPIDVANQGATVDARWGDTAFGIPYGLYTEIYGEDSFDMSRFPVPFGKRSYLYGADITYQIRNQAIKTFFEYTDNQCRDNLPNCTYEHSTYTEGYRYYGRSLGNTYDNDSTTYVLGFIGNSANGHQWKSNLRYLDLNKDNTNAAPPGGNRVALIAEKATQFDFSYIYPIWIGKMETGASYTYSTYENDIDNDNQFDVWTKYTIAF
ncbi:capsule assembly Wzi family protein [Vibrio sp. SS-MA-C1-2]|uniref:capsule assembly Wzi family protein n=1 Tax=Vibrio sp. SS-MA-C1-2 TaxID=2908646 RepID=UPI001F34816A|nr:capsule assembly Wzi family protein [Vibrio sp. SS-MA-C1-2]UJF18543.1 capsule assembly Wzi family protein [Vibrio sp. SS-MA-C1-2]